MQSVGKLDNDNTDILCHGEKHLTHVFRLQIQLVALILQLSQLCHTINEKCHIVTEFCPDLICRHDRIFHNIMQKSCRDRLLIHFQICQYDCNTKRVDNVWLSGFSCLILMCIIRHLIGTLDQRNIITRMVSSHTRDQILIQFLRCFVFRHSFNMTIIKYQFSFFLFFSLCQFSHYIAHSVFSLI